MNNQLITTSQVNICTNAKTDNQVIMMWLEQKSIATQKTYTIGIKQFFSFCHIELKQLTIEDLLSYRRHLIDQKQYKSNTITNKLMSIKSLLTFAHGIGYTQFNVGKIVQGNSTKDELNQRILNKTIVDTLINVIDTPRYKILFSLMYRLGLRVSEVCNLKWTDLRNNYLTVFGKGNKTRVLLVPEDLLNDLLRLHRPNNTFIFATRNNTAINRIAVHNLIKKYASIANINTALSCHWLRHTHATTAIENGCPLHLLKESLGHSSLSTTSRYLHVTAGECSSSFV